MSDIVGVLSFALHASHKIYDVAQTIKHAPAAVQALSMEASRVSDLLTKMLSAPGNPPAATLQSTNMDEPLVKGLLKDAEQLTAAVTTLLAKATTQNADGTYKVKKWLWPLHAGEASKLAGKFHAFYMSLTAVYALTTA